MCGSDESMHLDVCVQMCHLVKWSSFQMVVYAPVDMDVYGTRNVSGMHALIVEFVHASTYVSMLVLCVCMCMCMCHCPVMSVLS